MRQTKKETMNFEEYQKKLLEDKAGKDKKEGFDAQGGRTDNLDQEPGKP